MRRYPALPRPLLGGPGLGRQAGSRGARGSVGRGAARAQASGALGIRTRLGVTLDSWLGRPAAGRGVGLQRERHEPEYLIILAVEAGAAEERPRQCRIAPHGAPSPPSAAVRIPSRPDASARTAARNARPRAA